MTLDRLNERKSLLYQFDAARRDLFPLVEKLTGRQ